MSTTNDQDRQQTAFIASILEKSTEDADSIRQIYADWLDEQGDYDGAERQRAIVKARQELAKMIVQASPHAVTYADLARAIGMKGDFWKHFEAITEIYIPNILDEEEEEEEEEEDPWGDGGRCSC